MANARYLDDPSKYPPQALAGQLKLYSSDQDSEDEDEDYAVDSRIQIHEGVGILQISGSLVPEESWRDDYFGLTSYPVIARAVTKLAKMQADGEIHSIVHAFSTPGGDASGINGLTEVMLGARQMAPNTMSYTSSSALSAGYWLANNNPELYVDKMAEIGSVGAISTIASIHRRLKESGVDTVTLRSGKFKALLNPTEPLSEEGLKLQQEKMDQLHGFFKQHLVSQRPKLALTEPSKWAEGQTFFGEEAVQLGLADGIYTLNGLVERLISKHNSKQESKPRTVDYGRRSSYAAQAALSTQEPLMKVKQVVFFSEADRAKVASGVDLSTVPHELREIEVPDGELVNPIVEASSVAAASTETAASGDQTALSQQAPTDPKADESGLVAYLQAELRELRDAKAALDLEVQQLKGANQQLAAVEEQLAPIAVQAIQRLQVGLGQTPTTLKGLPAASLAAHYAEVHAQFVKTFPVGAHAQSELEESRAPVDLGEQRLALVK
jgi:ClpP class serine protease/FtsZ-binding cell division protein ZapB